MFRFVEPWFKKRVVWSMEIICSCELKKLLDKFTDLELGNLDLNPCSTAYQLHNIGQFTCLY